MKRIKLFEEFSEWDRDDFLLDLFAISKEEANGLFLKEIKNNNPNLEKIEVMIKSGLVDLDAKDNGDWTPLHMASERNDLETAKLLIKRGADVDVKNDLLQTPLHVASACNHTETAKLLLDAGADMDAKDVSGRTPLHWAHYNDSHDVIDLLIEMGADLDVNDDDGLLWNEHHPDYE